MIFKRLEIFGFKSFADKTTLHFEPGVTAIVGPNGSGKSNISDCIRWVLGEQSARAMRGTKMEDIIFSGTDNKGAVNLAEVSLILSNENKILPIEYDEITVTRRIYRSGDSEYLLNKTPVRLKDILELFMDTGIGTEAYSLIEQGKIDQILSSKPEERRVVFEEAAGITKYKAKKKEALRKLEQTEANLLRVNDIISEVGRQVSSVERQAQKARRYQEEFEKLKSADTKFNLINFRKLNSELESLQSRIAELSRKEKVKVEENVLLQARMAGMRVELEKQDEGFNSIRTRHSAVIHQIDKDKSHLPRIKERMEELRIRREDIAKELSALQERISELKKEESGIRDEIAFITEERDKKDKLNQEKLAEQEALSARIQECQNKVSGSKVELIDIASRQARAHNEIIRVTSELHNLE
ncbi:MAG: AAA family ATPase, partial [Candidatus Omnitrophica bacterium]|nr:AAA family ATPase [Candidatus Omnitrophota bacterium]